jgi:hypothetical protein
MRSELEIRKYLYEVRDLVIPELEDQREIERALTPRLSYREATPATKFRSLLFGGEDLGECFYTDGTSIASERSPKIPMEIVLYRDAFEAVPQSDLPRPYGELLAFVLIHELGHAVTSGGHESERWARACRKMGIAEYVYSEKVESGTFRFCNPRLLATIRSLPTYPGDVA